MKPTAHLRFVVRGVNKILQQWWTTSEYIPSLGTPDGCIGEWRDVELVKD